MNDQDDQIDRLRQRLLLAPQDVAAICDLAVLVETAGDLPQAIDLLQRALRVDPYQMLPLLGLGRLWATLGEAERARPWLLRARELEPENHEATALLESLETAPTEVYVRTLFDQYAPRFDVELTRTLHYQAPRLLAQLLSRHYDGHRMSVLDLGCGTGLSGAALRPFASRLDGVDLSPAMVARARELGVYDRLEVIEASQFLKTSDQSWDRIVAVDMLNYVGALAPLLSAAAGRIVPGGQFLGTAEKCDAGLVLTDKRRYAHGRDHLEAAAATAGLEPVEIAEGILRTEGGLPVPGLIFALRR